MIIFQDYKKMGLMHFLMAMNISMLMQVFSIMKNFKKCNTLMDLAVKKTLNGSFLREAINLYLQSKVIKFISSHWDILEDTLMTFAFLT